MLNIVFTVAYDGTKYLGYQKTAAGRSIEGSLEEAIQQFLPYPVMLQAASRTDRGVHARGQVINFHTPSLPFPIGKFPLVINRYLPDDIQVLKAQFAEKTFHSTLDAREKEYLYQVYTHPIQSPFTRRSSWHCFYPLDEEKIKEGSKILQEVAKFDPLTNKSADQRPSDTTKIDLIDIKRDKQILLFSIRGQNFGYKVVRNIVGTLIAIGRGKIPLDTLKENLAKKDRSFFAMTAPAHGLVLNRVSYYNCPFYKG